jgi:hypothetical protein
MRNKNPTDLRAKDSRDGIADLPEYGSPITYKRPLRWEALKQLTLLCC